MQNLWKECLVVHDLVAALLKGKLKGETLLGVLSFCDNDSISAEQILPTGWWDIPHAFFLKKIQDLDDERFIKHIAKTKKIIISIIYRNLIYTQLIKYEQIDQLQLFTHDERILRETIKTITYDILIYQIYADGVVFYEPKVISMCVCIYIADLYPKKSSQRTILEKLFKKYNERQYVDVILTDFEDGVIFVNECDLNLTSFAHATLVNYNMDTYTCFSKHNVYINKIIKIIKNHLEMTNMICLYQHLSTINNKIYIWWVIREMISLKEIVSIIVHNIIETE
jgi:hypothetical protein